MPWETWTFTNLTGWFNYANTVTNDYYGLTLVVSTFIIALLAMQAYNVGRSIGAAGFIATVFSVLLLMAGIVSEYIVICMVLVTALSSLIPGRS